jgi:hypothetical protein
MLEAELGRSLNATNDGLYLGDEFQLSNRTDASPFSISGMYRFENLAR